MGSKRINDTGSKWDTFDKVEEDILVNELEIDENVQRSLMSLSKINRFKAKWNPAAVGRILVSRRKDRSLRVLDGMHRVEAFRQLSDNTGFIPCEVYTGLTLEEEAELFLDKNAGDKPTPLDRYRVSVVGKLPVAIQVDAPIHAYGWTVAKYSSGSGGGSDSDGQLNCVVALQRLYKLSEEREQDPNLLQEALRIIGRVWGTDRSAGQGFVITALGRMVLEYGARLNSDRLIEQLRDYKGGITRLNATARQMATSRNWKLPMSWADLAVETYNKGLAEKNRLPRWSKRA
jgi:hypothetical protein